jgi:ribosomal protein S12 methylthiotransferase
MTGRYKSRTIESLEKESFYLAKNGVKEIILIAQDLSYYGNDIYGKNRLADLIERLSKIGGIEWIRLHYLYPSKFPTEILTVIRDNKKVCRYLDLPLQHISNPVLRRMHRYVTREETESLIRKLRKEIPGIILRTTMMVGFPGESEADFEELKQFVQDVKFERLGVFTYSHEEGTYAAKKYSDDVPHDIKQKRADEIMEIQREISAELNRQKTGKIFKVIIDRKEWDYYIGRTEFDSPEVDAEVLIYSGYKLTTGQFYMVKIRGTDDYDLTGEVVP